MAGSDGFRTAPLGFDRNDVNTYISKLIQRVKTAEAEKNESTALASKAKEMKESYETRIAELEESKKAYQTNTEKEIKEYKLTIEELDIKVVALLSEMEQRREADASTGSDANTKMQASEILKQAKFEAKQIIENAKRERQITINNAHYLLNTISAENKAINSAFNSIKNSLSKCVNADIESEFGAVVPEVAQTVDTTPQAVVSQASVPQENIVQAPVTPVSNIEYAPVEEIAVPKAEPVAQPIIEQVSEVVAESSSVQAEKPAFSHDELEDIFAVKDVKDDSLSDEILDFTEFKAVEKPTSTIDDDLSGLFAVPNEVSTSTEFDVAPNVPQMDDDFSGMMIKDEPDATQPSAVEDDLSLFFSVEDNSDEEVVDTTVDFTQMDTGVDESAFDIKPLEPDANLFDSLWTIGSDDDDDDDMSSDNVGIMEL